MEKTSFSGAVLAGGKSKRMGKDKASLRMGDRSMLELQLDKLRAAGIQDLMVSCAKGKRPEFPLDINNADHIVSGNLRIVEDLLPDKGPLAAIASVLTAADTKWCVILSVDALGVSPETIRKLMDAAENSSADIVILASPSGLQPLIGAYKKALAEEALALVNDGRLAVRALFDSHPPVLLELPEDSPELFNCNTPEDLAEFAALAEKRKIN